MSKNAKTEDVVSPAASLIKTMQDPKGMPLAGIATDWLDAMADMGNEMLRFTAARVAQDVHTQQALLHARGVEEIQHIQAEFFQKAMADYAAETTRMMDMAKALAAKKSSTFG